MTKEILEAVETIGRDFEAFKKSNKEEMKQLAEKGSVDPLLKEMNEKLNNAISTAEDAKEAAEQAQALAKRRNEVQNDLQKARANMSEEDLALRKAFLNYMRGGNDNLSPAEKQMLAAHSKAMSSFEGPDGGYAVMPELDRAIVSIIRETSPIRQYAEVLTIGSDRLEEPYEGDDFESGWVGEEADRAETTTGTLNMIAWDVHEQYAMPAITQKLLDDAYFDIEGYVTQKIASKLVRTENTAFVSGTGVNKPRGFLTYASGTAFNQIEQIASGSAGAITADGLMNLAESVKSDFLAGAVFMMKRSTVKNIRKLVDGNGNYLWGLGLNGPASADLLGYPIVRADDMPVVGSGNLSIAFGNFREGYRIVDRIGTRILRDPYTKKGYVRLYTTKRVGGGVRNFDAIKLHVLSAS